MKVDGSDLRRMTFDRRYDGDPIYSPDGDRIAFSSQLGEGLDVLPQIWVMNVDGSCPRQITAHGGKEPAWSPTGREIVYSRYNGQSDNPENGVLWIIDVETLCERQLTSKWPQRRPIDASLTVRDYGTTAEPRELHGAANSSAFPEGSFLKVATKQPWTSDTPDEGR